MRTEQEVFADLSLLCRSPGYVHAIAYLCFRDNMVRYYGEISAKDILPLFSTQRLIRTEISTLIGLMVQGEISYALPPSNVVQKYIEHTESLLEEMHEVLSESFVEALRQKNVSDADFNPLGVGRVLREAIFYSGESAYAFQYRDFAPKKYTADNGWLDLKQRFSDPSRDGGCYGDQPSPGGQDHVYS